jgi:hypothetical protein
LLTFPASLRFTDEDFMIRNLFTIVVLAVSTLAAETPLIDLVPSGATVIGGVHVDRTAGSPFGQFILSRMNESHKDIQKFIDATGFDPRRDLRELVFASAAEPKGPGLILGRGVFNGPQILAAAATKGGTQTTYKGVDLVETPGGKRTGALAVIDGSLAIAGDPALVRAAIDRRSTTAPASPLIPKATALSGAYDAWVVASGQFRPPVTAAPGSNRPNMPGSAAMQGIVETSGGLTFGAVVRFDGQAVTRSDKDALALVDVIHFLSSMVQVNGSQNPDVQKLQPVLDSLDVKAEANIVKVSVAIPQSDLEQIVKPKRSIRAAR